MTLSDKERQDIIDYRVERSYQSLKEAQDNISMGNWNLAVNRLYYSTFYMAMAVNLNNGDSAKTHSGVFNIFSKRYIATELIDKESGMLYRRLFTMRQTGDYDDLFDWTEEDVAPLLPLTEKLIKSMHNLM